MPLLSHTSPINWRAPLNRGLLRWWRSLPQQHGGNVWRDLTRKSDMTINGPTASHAMGLPGGSGCYTFDGSNDYAQAGPIDLTSVTQLTVAMWLYWGASGPAVDYPIETSANSSSTANAFYLNYGQATGSTQVRLRGTSAQSVANFTSPTSNVWHQIVYCLDIPAGGSCFTVYVNGVAQSLSYSATSQNATSFGNHTWNFGARNGASNFFTGRFGDVRVYNRILSASEAQQLYRASRVGYPNELRRVLNAPLSFEQVAAPATGGRYYLRKRRVA